MITKAQLETKLEILRQRYKNEPDNRKIIEVQGKAIKNALQILAETKDELTQDAVQMLM